MYWTLFTIQQRLRIPGTHDNMLWILLTIVNFLLMLLKINIISTKCPQHQICAQRVLKLIVYYI